MNMHAKLYALRCVMGAAALSLAGCQSMGRIVEQTSQSVPPRFLLVADASTQQQPPAEEKKEKKPETEDSKKPQQPERRYTAPGVAIQQISLLALGTPSSSTTADLAGAGREASQSSVTSGAGVLGRPGLSAPQPSVVGAVVSRPGLQAGPASGLGFAGRSNILTPQLNRLSGPTGRCGELASAGFFGRNQAACVQHFHR